MDVFKRLSKGKIIASLIALGIAGFFWNIFFPPGGSGANILLGLCVAIFFVYYFAGYFGALIDQELFPGGSKLRARLFRALQAFIEESKTHIENIKKSKRKRKKIGQKALDDFEQAMIQAVLVLNRVHDNWAQQDLMRDHERMLKEATDRLEKASQSVFGIHRRWRFIYGMPSLILALLCALALRECVIEPYQIPSGSMIPSLLVGDHLFVSKFYYGISKPFSSDPDFIIQWRKPKPGDVVVFKSPDYVGSHAGQAWIKRVIAVEGQSIKIKNHIVYVDDKPYIHTLEPKLVSYMDFFGFGGPFGGTWKRQNAYFTKEKIGDIEHDIYIPPFPLAASLGPFWPEQKLDLPGLDCDEDQCRIKPGHIFVMGDNRGNSKDSRAWGALPISRVKGRASFIWMSVDGSEQSVKLGPFNLPKFRFDRWFTSIN
jgi:signal peptidase I